MLIFLQTTTKRHALPTAKSVANWLPPTRLNLLGLISGVMLLLLHTFLIHPYTVDDTLISLRVLRQFLAGNGLVYNIGEHVQAYSNFLWMMLLAPGMAVGLDALLLTHLLGSICMLTALVCSWGVARQLSPDTAAAGLTAVLMAGLTSITFWSWAGLETPLVAALIAASTWSWLAEKSNGSGWRTGILLALLSLTRPEMIVIIGVSWLFEVIHNRGQNQPFFNRHLGWHIGVVAAVWLPYTVWQLWYYGDLLPATVRAKSTGLQLRTLVRGGYYLLDFLGERGILGIVFLALVGGAVLWVSSQRWNMLYIATIIVFYSLSIVVGGGDWMPVSRVFVHILPLILALAGVGGVTIVTWLATALNRRWLVMGLVSLVLLLQLGVTFFDGVDPKGSLVEKAGQSYPHPDVIAKLQPGDVLDVVDAGWIAYHAPLDVRVVDMVGLADNHIANLKPQFPGGAFASNNGFGRWDVDYYLAQNPRFVQILPAGTDANGNVLTGFIGTTQLVNDPRFKARYSLLSAGIYERKQ